MVEKYKIIWWLATRHLVAKIVILYCGDTTNILLQVCRNVNSELFFQLHKSNVVDLYCNLM